MMMHTVPEPGSGAICDEPCGHLACATGWGIARAGCVECSDLIGFGQRYVEDADGLYHRDCWLDQYEARPDAYGTAVVERQAAGL